MTSYFKQCLDRHFNNYVFTAGMFKHSPIEQAHLYARALKEIDALVEEFDRFGYPYGELSFYSKRYRHKIIHFYSHQLAQA